MTHRYPPGIVLTPMTHVHMTPCIPTITHRGSRDPIQSSPLGYIAQSPLVIVCSPSQYKHGLCVASSLVYIAVGLVLYFPRLDISGFPLDPSSSLLPGNLRELFQRSAYLLEQLLQWLLSSSSSPPRLSTVLLFGVLSPVTGGYLAWYLACVSARPFV